VYQAELTAISRVSRRLNELDTSGYDVTIFSDSKSSLEALTAYSIRNNTVKDCRSQLLELARNNQVTVKWIPGHAGLEGNEAADRMARQGSEMPYYGPQPAIPISLQHVRRCIKESVAKHHKIQWMNRGNCRQSRMFCREPSKVLGTNLLRMTRQETRRVIQIMSGHANLARHRHLCKKVNSPICPKCGSGEETAFHHIAKCPCYAHLRNECFQAFMLTEDDLPRLQIRSISSFLKKTERLDTPLAAHQ
jgi:hypothetical protein